MSKFINQTLARYGVTVDDLSRAKLTPIEFFNLVEGGDEVFDGGTNSAMAKMCAYMGIEYDPDEGVDLPYGYINEVVSKLKRER